MIVWRGFDLMHGDCVDTSKAELLIEVASNDGGYPGGMKNIILEEESSFGINHYFTIAHDTDYGFSDWVWQNCAVKNSHIFYYIK